MVGYLSGGRGGHSDGATVDWVATGFENGVAGCVEGHNMWHLAAAQCGLQLWLTRDSWYTVGCAIGRAVSRLPRKRTRLLRVSSTCVWRQGIRTIPRSPTSVCHERTTALN